MKKGKKGTKKKMKLTAAGGEAGGSGMAELRGCLFFLVV